MAKRPRNAPIPRSSIEAEWEELNHSLDDRLDDVGATAMAAEQLTGGESREDVIARQLAAFRADQEARGVAIRDAEDHTRQQQGPAAPLDRYADGPRYRG